MIIRQATIEDLPRLEQCANGFLDALERKFLGGFDMSRFVELWRQLINSGNGVIFLMLEGEKVVGAAGALAHQEQYCDYLVAQEFFWWVQPENRGLGGVRLYHQLEDWAREKGCKHLRMVYMVNSMPEKVGNFYERVGLKPMEVTYTKELA